HRSLLATGEPAQEGFSFLEVFRGDVCCGAVEHLKERLLPFTSSLPLDELADESGLVLAAPGPALQPGIGVAPDADADLVVFGGCWHVGTPAECQQDTELKV